MIVKHLLIVSVLLAGTIVTGSATVYSGNGSSDFGGAIGNGSLSLSDDGTTVTGTFTKGPGLFNDALVIYIDSVPGGFADTSTLADTADGLRKAISGFDGGSNRSILTLPAGFTADYVLALGPSSDSFGGLWQLAAGGNNSLVFLASASLSPLNNSSDVYTFTFTLAKIGLTPDSGASFNLFGTYISNSGYRSLEALVGDVSGTQGWNPFSSIATNSGTITNLYTTIPEPSTVALLWGSSALGGLYLLRRRRR